MTIQECSKYLGITKEAIYNRIRRNKLSYVEEDGIKYILIDKKSPLIKKRATNSNVEYIKSLEQRIQKLEQKLEKVENKNNQLRDEKEALLVESKEALKSFYKERDEQLKTILTLANNQFVNKPAIKKQDNSIDLIEIKEKKIKKDKKKDKSKKRKSLRSFLDL